MRQDKNASERHIEPKKLDEYPFEERAKLIKLLANSIKEVQGIFVSMGMNKGAAGSAAFQMFNFNDIEIGDFLPESKPARKGGKGH